MEELTKLLEAFFAERKPSIDAGWPEVTSKERQALNEIIRKIIRSYKVLTF